MPLPLDISFDRPYERDAILSFIAAMGFTPRDATTWDGLGMRAIVARQGERIVGVLPIEPRPVCVGDGRVVQGAHQTCVALAPEFRGGGIGSQMQRRLDELLEDRFELVSVCREDPTSPAYRWYVRNGFSPAMHVVSWERATPSGAGHETASAAEIDVAALWAEHRAQHALLVDQRQRPLREWLAIHAYRARYAFEIVPLAGRGYAVVGIGKLHSATPRLDILDLVARDAADARRLIELCMTLAADRGATPVRCAIAGNDPLTETLRSLGFTPGWPFDVLTKPRGASLSLANPRYASIDFA